MQTSSDSRSRALAIGILVIFVLLFLVVFVKPYLYVFEKSQDHVDSIAFQLDRNKKLLGKREFYLGEIDRLGDAYSAEDIFLSSTKNALATAEIQQIVKNISNKNKIELVSSQPVVNDLPSDSKVGVRIRVRTDVFGLQKTLYALETGSPKLFIDELLIQQGNRKVLRYNDTESSKQILNVNLQVFGYINKN